VARHWAGAGPQRNPADADSLVTALQAFGADEAEIARWTEPERTARVDEATEVLAVNEPAVRLFFALTTQWRRDAMGAVTGMDYAAIAPTARLMGIEVEPGVFDGLRDMELEALSVFRERLDA
jgi:hypothetical protein|tara:strand:- start:14766 stop:15134 length:369 start_codon:yes stop_codon:yes gene_type:complete